MHRKELYFQSPVRVLDRALRGGLGKGRLGALVGPAGVGKSSFLAQLGLDALLRDRPVLHVAVGHSVDHVAAWYDALFAEIAERAGLDDRGAAREALFRRRLIWSLAEAAFGPRSLDEAVEAFHAHLALEPALVVVDGLHGDGPGCAATVAALRASASAARAELWMTLRESAATGQRPGAESALPEACAALLDVALRLEPRGRHVGVTLIRTAEGACAVDLPLVLEGGLLRVAGGDASPGPPDAEAFTLLASGSVGAEEEFGACAERWGVREVNYTFEGREETGRTRGRVVLSDDELKLGEVSAAYVKAHLHRSFPETPAFGHVLQAIWHQVSTAGEVFAVGAVHADKTAHGGTGWAVELARHWGKPVHLFDQERRRWFRWDGRDWDEEPPPAITRARFAGTGTRALSAEGREAIRGLFERTFGPAAT